MRCPQSLSYPTTLLTADSELSCNKNMLYMCNKPACFSCDLWLTFTIVHLKGSLTPFVFYIFDFFCAYLAGYILPDVNTDVKPVMSVPGFRIREQKSNEFGALSAVLEFSVPLAQVSKIELVFCTDITDPAHAREIPVDAALTEEERDGAAFVTATVSDFSFAPDIAVDELTNFSALRVACEGWTEGGANS